MTTLRFAPVAVSVVTLLAASSLTRTAQAEEGWLTNGEAGIATGLEGGDTGNGKIGWRRARTRIVLGGELRAADDADEGYAVRLFAEVEKRGSVGGEARYVRWATPKLGLYAGLAGTIAPETLVGAGAGARFLFPMGRRADLFLEPSFTALPLGSDLPSSTPLFWALMTAGVRLGL